MKQKSVLITGVAGLIGSRFADYVLSNTDYSVVGIDDLFGGYEENMPLESDRFTFCKMTLGEDSQGLDYIFKEHRPEYVFHFAAYAAEGLSPFIRNFNYKNNVLSTVSIVNCCIRYDVKRLVYTSSMSVYGKGVNPTERFDENQTPAPEDPYAISKYACEMDIKSAGCTHNLDWCILRPHNCYSDDTEILTENGWKLFKDLEKDERVLTLDTKTKMMEYNTPTEYHKYYIDDYLYHFNSNGIDLMVTGDHNMVTRTSSKNKIQKILAKDIYDNPKKYYYYETLKSGYEINQGRCDDIILPEILDSLGRSMVNEHQNGKEKRIKAEDWFTFLGWFISEGSCYKTKTNYTISICQYESVHAENCDDIKSVIKRMGFDFYVNTNDIKIYSKQLYTFLKKLFPESGATNKYIPREYLSYNKKCLSCLYESLMRGDGNSDGTIYSTASKRLADDFSELLIKIGKCGNIRKDNDGNHVIYRVSITKHKNPSFGDMRTRELCCTKERYKGYVYDITVPNHVIYVRRNGKGCWGSNCYGICQNIWDRYRNVLGIWMYQKLNNEPLTIYGDGEQSRAFSYIDDALPCIWKAAVLPEASKQIINLGGKKRYTINEACAVIQDVFGGDVPVQHLEARYEVKHAIPTFSKSVRLLGYEETVDLKEGLARMWEWAQKQPKRGRFKWPSYEIDKGIYSYWK